jgi:hypothetical protein
MGVDLIDRADAQRRQIGLHLVVVRLIGAIGRPQRAVVVQGIELALAGRPTGVEQRRRIIRSFENDCNVQRERGDRCAARQCRRSAAPAVEI